MFATLIQNATPLGESSNAMHILVVLPKPNKSSGKLQNMPDFLGKSVLGARLSRRKMQLGEIGDTPAAANLGEWRPMRLGPGGSRQIHIRAANLRSQSGESAAG